VTDVDSESGAILDEIFAGDTSIYRLLLETSIDPVAIFDEHVNFVFVTPGYERLVGRNAAELLGTSGAALVHPDDVEGLQQELGGLLASGTGRLDGIRLRRRDGSYVYISAVARTFVARNGSTLLVTFIHDLTPHKRVEEELRASEGRYRGLVEGIEAIVWEADARSLDFTFVSPRAVEVLGFPLEDWYESGFWLARLHPEDRERTYAACLECVQAAVDHELLYRMLNAAGEAVWLRDLVRVEVVEGEVELLRGVMMDVTAQVEADAQRARLEEDLRQAQRLDAVGRLAGGIAHDFNNLLTAISGYAELALQDTGSESVRAELTHIHDASNRAAGLTRQLLAFSRRQQLEPELIDLNEVVVEMAGMLQRLIGTHVELLIDLGPDLQPTLADPTQVQQIILNLAVNARDAMPSGGRLEISTANVERKGRMFAALTVSDTGVGMDEQTRAQAFDPFFTTKPVGEGTGLGLATVHGIAKQSGGEVEIESEPGRGTTFRILLAAAEPDSSPG
jgi:two-component system, cell cycle sensor histidine kinase and response regulator CckA